MTDAERAGIVLAGGHSKRFGDREKALAEIGGSTMLERVVDRLREAVDTVVVNCRADQREDFERALVTDSTEHPVRFAIDPVPDRGPLAGLGTALRCVEAEYVAVVACDMPDIDPSFLAYLFDRASGHDAAVPVLEDGYLQPAQAVYRTAVTHAATDQHLEDGRGSLRSPLADLDIVEVTPAEIRERTTFRTFRDVNTPDALAEFEGEN